jgi:hypothetical protein
MGWSRLGVPWWGLVRSSTDPAFSVHVPAQISHIDVINRYFRFDNNP